MASDPESLTAVKANTNKRVFKICVVVISLACVSVIAYAGLGGSSADGRRLQAICPSDQKSCLHDGYSVMRVPELNCQFPACPGEGGGGGGVAVGGVVSTGGSGTTVPPKANVGAIVGGTIAGAAVVGGVVAGAVYFSQHPIAGRATPGTSVPPPPGYQYIGNNTMLYEETDVIKTAAAPGSLSQGMLVGVASFGFFTLVFFAVTGGMYVYKKRFSEETHQAVPAEVSEEIGLE